MNRTITIISALVAVACEQGAWSDTPDQPGQPSSAQTAAPAPSDGDRTDSLGTNQQTVPPSTAVGEEEKSNPVAQPEPAKTNQSQTPNASGSQDGELKAGTSQSSFELGAQEKMLAWERWHERVGKALSKSITKATGVMMGTALLHITVHKDHSISADLLTATNAHMGELAVSGVNALNGAQVLEFPAESKRENISINFQYKRSLFTLPRHEYIKDDYERMEDGPRP